MALKINSANFIQTKMMKILPKHKIGLSAETRLPKRSQKQTRKEKVLTTAYKDIRKDVSLLCRLNVMLAPKRRTKNSTEGSCCL